MKIEKNSRQIPKITEICSDKKYSDMVYGWFQDVSQWDQEGERYVALKDINYQQIGERVKLTRQTVSKRIKNLEDMGLICKNEMKKRYEIRVLERVDASLIPQHTLKFLVDSQSDNTISIYVYLLNKYWANGKQPFYFTIPEVKAFLGLSVRTTSNNHCVMNPLFSLRNNGLIDFELMEDHTSIKTKYLIKSMSFNPKC